MLDTVDYDDKQHVGYQKGRRLPETSRQAWLEAFVAHAPRRRPLRVLDLGSGTGRFTPALAEVFGGPITGVEPSDKMRAIAEASAQHFNVGYKAGQAEAIPLEDGSCDLVLMFLSFHHVVDKPAAAAEIARVLAPGGRVFIRSTFSDRMPNLDWHRYFPSARAIEMEMFPTVGQVVDVFAAAGLHRRSLVQVHETFADSLADNAERLRTRAISTFDHLSEEEIRDGFASLDEAVAAETEPRPITSLSDLLVLG